MARKNRREIKTKKCRDEDIGVDLNRNYDYDFAKDNEGSSNDPCQEDYRGEKPFSEPETKAIKDFVDSHPNIKIVYNYHTWGNLIITPFNCLKKKDSENLLKTKYTLNDDEKFDDLLEDIYGMMLDIFYYNEYRISNRELDYYEPFTDARPKTLIKK